MLYPRMILQKQIMLKQQDDSPYLDNTFLFHVNAGAPETL